MIRRLISLTLALATLPLWISSSVTAQSPNVASAIAWYDALGFPDARDLPYVRVATGRWRQVGNQPPENRFVDGFLLREDAESFTVYLCSVSEFASRWSDRPPYAPLTTVRFVRKITGPAHQQVHYEVRDFRKASAEVLDRVRQQASSADGFLRDPYSRPVTHRVRIFAFARASLQQGLSDVGAALIEIASAIPVGQTERVEPERLREILQQQIGDAVLAQAEIDAGDPEISWAELLKGYDGFETRFPASQRSAYARDAADVLRRMIAEDAVHHPKPLAQMSPTEQVAESIYQLRNLKLIPPYWSNSSRYPVAYDRRDGSDVPTPVHRLVDLGNAAVPQLMDALDDRSFTRSMLASFNGTELPTAMRVSDFARNILNFMSGRNFSMWRASDGTLIAGTVRQRAEAWWAEVWTKGERQELIDSAAAGGSTGLNAARKLVERYPDAAMSAIVAGMQATPDAGLRGEFVAAAGLIAGDAPVAFLRSQLAPTAGLYAQVRAAQALFARGEVDSVPAMIEAWRNVQPRLRMNESDAYAEVGGLITFLAKSGDVRAIDALGERVQQAPIEVRLAVVKVFLPWPKSAGQSTSGPTIHVGADIASLPSGEAGTAIERLLVVALGDKEPRVGLSGTYDEVTYEDPRVADIAALTLSKRWPAKYTFRWSESIAERDAQIESIRNSRGGATPQASPVFDGVDQTRASGTPVEA